MGELLRCNVRDISEKGAKARWEIRFHRKLPPAIKRIGGMKIKLKFSQDEYNAVTGIACAGSQNEYFWINTHKDDSGFLINILQKYNYKRNEEILLHISHEDELIGYVVRLA